MGHRPELPGVLRNRSARAAAVVLGCFGLAALTLLLPSTPSYDSWSWIAWGREILHLDLSTRHGPSWKPLPVLFTTVFAGFGAAAPDLWLAVARASGLAALLLAFRLAQRLAGRGRAGVPAGLLAIVGLALSLKWFRSVALGASEPLLVASVLGAAGLHLDGRYRPAFAVGSIAGLTGPEAWPLIGIYGVWLLRHDRRAWPLVAGAWAVFGALWLVPPWLGSGEPLQAFVRARNQDRNSYAAFADPTGAAFRDAARGLMLPLLVGAGVGAAAALVGRAPKALLGFALAGLAWIAVVIAGVAAGFAGNPRYLMGGLALLAVAGGAGWVVGTRALVRESSRRFRAARWTPGVVAVAILVALGVGWAPSQVGTVQAEGRRIERLADAREALPGAIARAGGRTALLTCGPIRADRLAFPVLSWYLDAHAARFSSLRRHRGWAIAVQSTGAERAGGHEPRGGRLVAAAGPWRVYDLGCRGT